MPGSKLTVDSFRSPHDFRADISALV